MLARSRCEYSMIAWYSNGGIHRPKQVGHPGHPRPESVARTSPPTAMSSSTEAVVAIESFWRRVIVGAAGVRATIAVDGARADPDAGCHTSAVPGVQPREPRCFSPALDAVRSQLEPVLGGFLRDRRAELAAMDPAAVALADELLRLTRAGGKRLRPALAYWSHRAAGAEPGEQIL